MYANESSGGTVWVPALEKVFLRLEVCLPPMEAADRKDILEDVLKLCGGQLSPELKSPAEEAIDPRPELPEDATTFGLEIPIFDDRNESFMQEVVRVSIGAEWVRQCTRLTRRISPGFYLTIPYGQ